MRPGIASLQPPLSRLNADIKLFRLLTFTCLPSGTGGGGGTLFAPGLVPLTVERRFAVLADVPSSCGRACGGDCDFELLREWLLARADLGGVSRYAGLVLSVWDVAVDVLGLSGTDALVGDLGLLMGDDNAGVFPTGDVIVGVGVCFCTGVLLRELVCKAGKENFRVSFECCRGSFLIVGAGAPSSLLRLGSRSNFSELDQIGPPLTVFGLPKGVLVSGPSRSSFVMPLRRNPFNAAKLPVVGVPFPVDGRSSFFL